MKIGHRAISRYLSFQAAIVAAWWIAMFLRPDWRVWFFAYPASWSDWVLPDAAVFVALGLAASFGLQNRRSWGPSLFLLHTGGVGYATLACIGQTVSTGRAGLGAVLMLEATVVLGAIVTRLNDDEDA